MRGYIIFRYKNSFLLRHVFIWLRAGIPDLSASKRVGTRQVSFVGIASVHNNEG